jgi:hypothetical protein
VTEVKKRIAIILTQGEFNGKYLIEEIKEYKNKGFDFKFDLEYYIKACGEPIEIRNNQFEYIVYFDTRKRVSVYF